MPLLSPQKWRTGEGNLECGGSTPLCFLREQPVEVEDEFVGREKQCTPSQVIRILKRKMGSGVEPPHSKAIAPLNFENQFPTASSRASALVSSS